MRKRPVRSMKPHLPRASATGCSPACLLTRPSCAAQEGRVSKHAGLHPVADARGKWGFIDRTGRFRIPPRYDGAGQFSEGVAYVYISEGGRRRDGIVTVDGRFT